MRLSRSVAAIASMTALSLSATPVVKESSVTMSQNGGVVTIGYELEEEAGIVTVDIQTNGVSIGGANLSFMAGDVNRLVQPGTRTVTWRPYKAWPGQRASNARAVVSAWAKDAPPDYMVVSLLASRSTRYFARAEEIPFGVTNDLYKTEYLALRRIPAANVTWRMGSPPTESGRKTDETPHLVTLSNDYYFAVYPVTQRQYELVCGARAGCRFTNADDYATRPVENVSFSAVRGNQSEYSWPSAGHSASSSGLIGRLRALTGIDAFDLPTEAQWEFACRAGCGAALYSGKELGSNTVLSPAASELARYMDNGGWIGGAEPDRNCTAEHGTAKVDAYPPNAWGLYGLYGSVWEFCLDWYAENIVDVDPEKGPASGTARVVRGGGYNYQAHCCRSAQRANFPPDAEGPSMGFRLCCAIPAVE